MHLLFDARLLHRPLSGLERVQRNLLRELALQPKITRLRVLVMHGTRLPATFPQRAEPIFVHGTEDILRVLSTADPKERPDVYHLSWFPDRTPRDLWLPLAAKASVVEVHDAILNRHPEYHPNRDAWAWYHAFVKTLVRSCDRLLCHSTSVVQEVQRDLDGDPHIATVAPLAVEPTLRAPLAAADVQQRLQKLGVSGPFFLAVGKDYPHKDHATMFRAIAKLTPRIPVVCAGSQVWSGPQSTRELLAQLGMTQSVRWIEGLDDDDVKALIQGAKALVYPSLEEGFGLPPIEAMALGTPVLAAASMSIPEVCDDGAWLFPAGDVDALAGLMQKVLAGGDEVAKLVARGRARESMYSWQRCAERTVACYEQAIADSKSRKKRARPPLPPEIARVLDVLATCPFSVERELTAWQERCLSVENTLRELQAKVAGQPRPGPLTQPTAPSALTEREPDEPRARFSLKRRIGKIKDGIKRRIGKGG
jgi:glycosyltransferase involved in cell wall biosynthesis